MRYAPFVYYAVTVFLLGALLAYPVFLVSELIVSEAIPFHKLTLRLLKLLSLLLLWPLLRSLKLVGATPWGYGPSRCQRSTMSSVLRGFVFGVAMLFLIVLPLIALDVRVLSHESVALATIMKFVLLALFIGILVALIEETWFRGALHSAVAKMGGVRNALIVTAVLYGAVHFVRADVPVGADEVKWSSGFIVVTELFYRFTNPANVSSFLALVAAGFILTLRRISDGRIAECIGIHAGWVAMIKIVRKLTDLDPAHPWASLAGYYDGVIGWWALVVFSAVAWWCWHRQGQAVLSSTTRV